MKSPPKYLQPATKESLSPSYRFGRFKLCATTRQLFHDDTAVPTAPQVFDLLLLLVSQHPAVVTKQVLRERVWPRRVVTDAALNQALLQARRLLSRLEAGGPWIVSLPRVGYRFAGPVLIEPALGPASPAVQDLTADQVLYREAFERWVKADTEGLKLSIAALRGPEAGLAQPLGRVRALLFESGLDRQAWKMQDAGAKIETAELTCSQHGLHGAAVLLGTCRALMLFQFVSPTEAIPEFTATWELAQQQGEPFERALCAFYLAACAARVEREADFVKWADTALRLATGADMPWLWGSLACSLAGACYMLGEAAAKADQHEQARRLWQRSAELLMQSGVPDTAAKGSRLARVVQGNLALFRSKLDPALRPAAVATFRQLLIEESDALIRLTLLLGLAEMLWRENVPDEAMDFCQAGLELGQSTGITRYRGELLEAAADICVARGDPAQAVEYLKRLLRWRNERSRLDAEQAAAMTSIRLGTVRAVALADSKITRSNA